MAPLQVGNEGFGVGQACRTLTDRKTRQNATPCGGCARISLFRRQYQGIFSFLLMLQQLNFWIIHVLQ